MNVVERIVDSSSPLLSVRLRLLKKSLRHDVFATLIRRLARPGAVAVDIGANRGVYTWLLASRVGGTGRVHAIEPYPANVRRLAKLARRRPRITVHPVAASDRNGVADLYVPRYAGHEIDALATLGSYEQDGETLRVPVWPLDDLLAEEVAPVDIVKCDVEGHEEAVLDGGWGVIESSRPALLFELEQRHRSTPLAETFDRLISVGYQGYFVDGARLRPLAEFDVQRHQLAFLDEEFVPFEMPSGYVYDFVFLAETP